ncbi:MAG: hypothetical protein ACLTDV_02390 [Eubacterium sp.]
MRSRHNTDGAMGLDDVGGMASATLNVHDWNTTELIAGSVEPAYAQVWPDIAYEMYMRALMEKLSIWQLPGNVIGITFVRIVVCC